MGTSKVQRTNVCITLPVRVLNLLDAYAEAHCISRSGAIVALVSEPLQVATSPTSSPRTGDAR